MATFISASKSPMRVKCSHGYFVLSETAVGQAVDFGTLYSQSVVPRSNGDQFTFEPLSALPDHVLFGAPYLNQVATKTYAGKPWEIMRANGWVYDLVNGILVPVTSVTTETPVYSAGNRFVAPGLIQPGSKVGSQRILGYTAWFSRQRRSWLYSEVDYV